VVLMCRWPSAVWWTYPGFVDTNRPWFEVRSNTSGLTAVLTGMRRGELLGLRWEDVDFQHSTIHVQRALWKDKLVTPKSRRLSLPVLLVQ